MADRFHQTCFQIEAADNVCTALSDLEPGWVKVTGGPAYPAIAIAAPIKNGHKLANRPIGAGEAIIKYGIAIGEATRLIGAGEWVHLHNCRSRYDARSSTLDPETGAPTDTRYK
ncbi:SAF domain-containing protein [Hydrogenispora ethanolica]|uniref:SAF domain-containing protein n=1 Tax=Hydrogenispora ethanolica TaxID=1082276 RepID=A0A4R1R5R1_HYDET|nr:UxaA family hydrolase [Hydrogenispora ethanolica]TCL60849.1 SAF domain-containing protein [Hydrogenispora ethanolica]